MFLIRQSKAEDVGTLLKLARMVYFINLPPDERLLMAKIQQSAACFRSAAAMDEEEAGRGGGRDGGIRGLAHHESDVFMFTIVETATGGVVGTSQVRAHMGGPGNPNYSLKVFSREFRSASLGIGTTHLVSRLHADESGPTELGGLVIQPSFRGHASRPGRFLSWVRFHFVGMRRALFAPKMIAELAPAVTSDGDNLFWDSIGRKFIPVKYSEADRFCQLNRKFIDELYPKDDIYLTLLPLEVLNQVAQVGPETVPARRMLEKLGFQYKNYIDPFDGGPHVEAATDRISLVKDTRPAVFGETLGPKATPTHRGIVSVLRPDGEFRALECEMAFDKNGRLSILREALDALGASRGDACYATPFERLAAGKPAKPPAKKPAKRKIRA